MKIEMMEYLSNKISDVNIQKKVIEVLDGMNFLETKEIVNALEECDFNEYAIDLVINENVLKTRTVEEQIRLIEVLKENDYNEDVYNIITSFYVLKNRITDEQIRLIEVLKENDYNVNVYYAIIDLFLLKNRTVEEQIKLIEVLKNSDYNKNAYEIIIDSEILKNRTMEDQIKMIELLKMQKIYHDENINNKLPLKDFKSYLKELKSKMGKDVDIKSDTMVKVYNPKE